MKNGYLNFTCHLTGIFIMCMFFTNKMAFDGHDTRQIPALFTSTIKAAFWNPNEAFDRHIQWMWSNIYIDCHSLIFLFHKVLVNFAQGMSVNALYLAVSQMLIWVKITVYFNLTLVFIHDMSHFCALPYMMHCRKITIY